MEEGTGFEPVGQGCYPSPKWLAATLNKPASDILPNAEHINYCSANVWLQTTSQTIGIEPLLYLATCTGIGPVPTP